MEKLIRLVLGLQCPICPHRDKPRCVDELKGHQCIPDTKEVITRIGKAVLSGEYPELDKLLGVAGRWPMASPGWAGRWSRKRQKEGYAWIDEIIEQVGHIPDFIALGKEEKKGASEKAS